MATYKEMYYRLFSRVEDARCKMEAGDVEEAYRLLNEAQLETEDMYINGEED